MNPRIVGSLVMATLFLTVSAAEYVSTWTGAVDNNFVNKGNWDQPPANTGTLRFTNSVNLVYNTGIDAADKIASNAHGAKWWLDAEGITVVFGKTSSHYICGSSPTVDVAKDSLLVVSNRFDRYNAATSFYKKGAGTFLMHGYLDVYNTPIKQLRVEAGTMKFKRPGSENRVGFGMDEVYVSSGAEFALEGPMTSIRTTLAINVETNGVVRFTDVLTYQLAPLEISSVSGAGEVIADGTSYSQLKFNLDRQAEMGPFTGRMSGKLILDFLAKNNADDGQRFVLHRADALDGIRVRNGGAVVPVKGLVDATYYADGYNGTDILRLEDADGDPADRAVNVASERSLLIKGRGNLTIKRQWEGGSPTILQPKVSFVGNLTYAGDATLMLGDGTVENAFDLTGNGNIKGLEIATGSKLALKGNRGTADFAAVNVPITGGGSLFNQDTHYELSNFNMTGNLFRSWNKTRFTGGRATLKTFESGQTTSHEITVAGASITGGESVGQYSRSPLPTPDGVALSGNAGMFNVGVDAGELAYGSGSGWSKMTLRGGRLWWKDGVWVGTSSSVVFDGGELVADHKNQFYTYHVSRNEAGITNYVGAAGGRITVVNGGLTAGTYYNPRTASLPGVTSGELSFYGDSEWLFGTRLGLTSGAIHFRDGALKPCKNQFPSGADAYVFGDAEARFTDSEIIFTHNDWASEPPAVSFRSLAYDGVFGIRHNDKAAVVVADSLRRMGAGSLIVLGDSSVGTAGKSAFKVTGGVEGGGHAVVCVDVGQYKFAKYDAEAGYQAVSDAECATDYTQATADKYLVIGNSVRVAKDTTVRALGAKHSNGYNVTTTLGEGSVLKLGNGVDPALFIFGMKGALKGAGSVDFGSSEGIFTVSYSENAAPADDKQCDLACAEIRGESDVAYVSWGGESVQYRWLRVGAHGKYAGKTFIAGCAVVPTVADAFSSGTVVIKPGERRGGRVRFFDPLTFANAFTVGGTGTGDGNGEFDGAICFNANATISGDVTIAERARISAFGGARGTVSGDVSGGRLEIYTAKTDAGTVALTGDNSYTNGTEVLYATLAVDSAAALGSGEVALASGTLRFENSSPITVANDLRGSGTLALTGANVSFTGCRDRLGAVGLDIPGSRVTLSEIPDFVTGITNSKTNKSVLRLTGGHGFTIDPSTFSGKIELVLDAGSTLDLGGGTLTVYRFTGDRAAVNGTIVETNPSQGLLLLVK